MNVNLVSKRILLANFNGNPQTSIIVYYSPTNVSHQIEIDNFYLSLNAMTRQIPKHYMLIITGDFNDHLGIQDGFKFSLHEQLNRNIIYLKTTS